MIRRAATPFGASALALAAALGAGLATPAAADAAKAPEKLDVLAAYGDLAQAGYGDALTAARRLQDATTALLAAPSDATLAAARAAWRAARVPYMQTEAFRFGNPIVDAWEGRVNSWPLDEGLIDYVDGGGATDENPYAAVNVIANKTFELSGETVDASKITPELLSEKLQEADGIEANVATGYHAIEFMLWGQDLNGTGAGAGARPWTDFAAGAECTHDNCDRRADYLTAAVTLLVSDLEYITGEWAADGEARKALTADPDAGITAILTGIGSLSYGELGGERMKLGLMLNDPEEEQDCFSDNTYNSHYYDGLGMRNVYAGRYVGIDGTLTTGPSVAELVAAKDPEADAAMREALDRSVQALGEIKTAAEAGFSYDMMLARGSEAGEALIGGAVEALVAQTRAVERAVAALDLAPIAIEGSDSLDNPTSIFQ